MPATSRSGESGRRRSSSGWPGSPSKSISSQASGVRSTWPRCRSPCTRWTVTCSPAELAEPLARCAGTYCASSGTASAAAAQPGQHRVDRERRRGRCPAPRRGSGAPTATASPSRYDSPAKSPPTSSARSSRVGEQVAGAGGGHRPALGGVRRVRGDHAQRARLAVARCVSNDAEQPGHVRVAGPAEHPVELEVRVDARRSTRRKTLRIAALLEDHAGVALLGVEDPGRRVERQRRRRAPARSAASPTVAPAVDQREQVLGGVRVVERVVAGAVAVGADRGHRAVLGDRRVSPRPTSTW